MISSDSGLSKHRGYSNMAVFYRGNFDGEKMIINYEIWGSHFFVDKPKLLDFMIINGIILNGGRNSSLKLNLA